MFGRLLTEDFLAEGIKATGEYRALNADSRAQQLGALRSLFREFLRRKAPNEAVTESDLIYPVLEVLGWQKPLVQQAAGRGRSDVPDALLFTDADDLRAAQAEEREDRSYLHGATFVEAKRWERALDRGDATDLTDSRVPSNQMLRYLSQVEVASDGAIDWGILTNGRDWRLYAQKSTNRAEEFVEFDVPMLLGLTDDSDSVSAVEARDHLLTCFLLLFRPAAFVSQSELDGHTFLEYARSEARLWEERVARDVSKVVFEEVFPELLKGFASRDPERPAVLTETYLDELRNAALVFLYRLLFLLHAEDRDLLPVRDSRYDDYSLRKHRLDVADRVEASDAFSSNQDRYYRQLASLFSAIDKGDDSIGLPPYNGGLFDAVEHSTLERLSLSDESFARVLDSLSRRLVDGDRRWINFRDLSVQQLGSIYERLMEYRAVSPDGEQIDVAQSTYSRRSSGSYYTPESLVQLTLERTLAPLIEERVRAFDEELRQLSKTRKAYKRRLEKLADVDPATRILELRVLDPAMGSGHFLVSAVDFLADRTLELIAYAEAQVSLAGWKYAYASPLTERLQAIRSRILEQAREHDWPIEEAQLDDRHLVRRVLLKRVIYGVDVNPMTVELAKLSLWLHSFTVGAPLSFLDHHLRCGNSLVGAWVEEVRDRMQRSGLWGSAFAGMLNATEMMRDLEEMTDADIAEVKASATIFHSIEDTLTPYRRFLALDTADDWLGITSSGTRNRKKNQNAAFSGRDILSGFFGDPLGLVENPGDAEAPGIQKAIRRALTAEHGIRFFPWELMFPEVWYKKARRRDDPGFDAVIGNPPWDRVKLQQVEFFAERLPSIARAATAAERKRLIHQLEKRKDPLWQEYQAAVADAERMAAYARTSGHYPQLSAGDVNLYALFVERAFSLIRSRGMVGVLVPSGIAADRGSADFFGDLATSGRLRTLFDFENKKVFFPDVHASFKFSLFGGGGTARSFPTADCAFYLHSSEEASDPDRRFDFTPADFEAVNPNTRTAPVFRTRRDAEITRNIYRRMSVLVNRQGDAEKNPWGVRYFTMFHMTNDSSLFRTAAELETDGYYPVDGGRWRKAKSEYVPLYEGKMVQMYDHRAASVEVDTSRTHRPGQPRSATIAQHSDPGWVPTPQFLVDSSNVKASLPDTIQVAPTWFLGFKDVTAPTNQRTMIAAIVPWAGIGNTLPLLLEIEAASAACLLGVMNSFVFDYVARQKVQGQHLNLYIVEQLPVPAPEDFDQLVGDASIQKFVTDRVLRLSFTGVDLAPFAKDLGYKKDPFPWDEDERRHLMAQLDALMFRLFGITDSDDVDYILSTFPIIRRQDEEMHGRFLTRDLILAYFRAHEVGDFESWVTIRPL